MNEAKDSEISREAQALRRWLSEEALPLWWQVGADRTGGGFYDAIDLDGKPVARPRRARSVARMAFSYCEAGRLGWNGPWDEAARHALDYLRGHFVGEDGTVASLVGLDGKISDPAFDLYNQAFALLAYASGHRAFGETAGWRADAARLRGTLAQFYSHPGGGYREDRDGRLPQRSNPHMHLLEAALAWLALDEDTAWRGMADRIATLCLDKFIDPETGALREFFSDDWSPAPGIAGSIAEPGHHYEWALLLDRWAALTSRERPAAVARLIAFADRHGLDPARGVAVNAVLIDGSMHDPVARLWAQAERLRAYTIDRRPNDEERLAAAIKGLRRFLATPTPGLWFDQITAENRFVVEPARATSLYHLVGAITELVKVTRIDPAARAQSDVTPGPR
jgi:mannose/cellobiose epimerase-like protein (N-acyl-D-glucosamine 2-epimerase family)